MVLLGNIIFLLGLPILNNISIISDYIIIFYLIVFFQAINTTLSQFARGIGYVKIFAVNGIVNTIVTVFFNIILLLKYNMGIKGYLISILLANIVCSIYIMKSINISMYFNIKYLNYKLLKEMLTYSIPLMPNSLMWWIMNASDRYIIASVLGISANGIYAIAYKVPTILNILSSVFFQAWQLSAIEEVDSDKKSEFYSNIFNIFSTLMLGGVSLILVVIKPIAELGLSNNFSSAWRYVPFLLIAVVFTSFSSFLGTNYVAMKKTKGALKTSIIGGISNIALNIILIPKMGLNGAAFATMISFLLVWIYRINDTKEYITIKLDTKSLILNFIFIAIQIIIIFIGINIYLSTLINSIIFLLIIIINRNIVNIIYSKLTRCAS